MLHFSRIIKNGKEFNLIASGALAFKVYNKILRDAAYNNCDISGCSLLSSSLKKAQHLFAGKKVFFCIISDLDRVNTEALCEQIKVARENGSYAVCEVIAMYYNERNLKAIKHLRETFHEMIELSKISIGNSKALIYSEHQACLISDFSLSMARIMFHVCADDYLADMKKEPKQSILRKAV